MLERYKKIQIRVCEGEKYQAVVCVGAYVCAAGTAALQKARWIWNCLPQVNTSTCIVIIKCWWAQVPSAVGNTKPDPSTSHPLRFFPLRCAKCLPKEDFTYVFIITSTELFIGVIPHKKTHTDLHSVHLFVYKLSPGVCFVYILVSPTLCVVCVASMWYGWLSHFIDSIL